ncbi:MAG TPA: lysylphosphatidylglycerol synthase transmembrane domain-containing protein [Kofleriaceae bacterium]|nr:lysylphosphatidylglycerol synthase transmembrane domain-containing protein [Kofleriaceae bacterium]
MRLAINLTLSLGMLALCTWLVWPDAAERVQLQAVIGGLRWADFAPYLAGYLGIQALVHVCRCVRWNHLLAPLGVRVPYGPLFAISSVGFMAILAFPARLGELVRPGLLRKSGYTTTAAALGTVAVERIVDGLVISLLVFGAFFAHRGPGSPSWMMPTAYLALGVFTAALVFLVFAMWRPQQTVRIGLSLTLLPRFAPRLASVIEHRLLDMIRGFAALKDLRSLAGFLAWSLTYWAINGFAMWLLAHAFHLELSLVGAYATMGLLGVGISLPNSPGLVGQFQAFTLLGLSLYLDLGDAPAHTPLYAVALTYAIAQHLLQVAWYVTMGAIGLATPWVSFHDLWSARKVASEDTEEAGDAGAPAGAEAHAPVVPGRSNGAGDDKKLAPGPRGPDDPAHAHDPS